MLFERPTTSTMEEMLAKFAVIEAIEFERFCRDNALWEEMRKCFTKDSTVTISWYKGSGAGFVEASRKMESKAPHKINNTLVWLNKARTRATAICMACIQMRREINGIAMDLLSYARLVYTMEKNENGWQVASFEAIYEKDCLVPASPAGFVPQGRVSYGNLSAMLGAQGYAIDQELPGDDKPETLVPLMNKVKAWIED
jgi:hypothetical protein